MKITLPHHLLTDLQTLAKRQGKEPAILVIELLNQSVKSLLEKPPYKTPAFMRFAGIAKDEAAIWMGIEADVERDRALDQHRHLDL